MSQSRKMDYDEIWRRVQAGQFQTRIAGEMGYNVSTVAKAIQSMRQRGGPNVKARSHERCRDMEKRIAKCNPAATSECDKCRECWLCRLRVKFCGPTACEYKRQVLWEGI